MLVQYYGTCSFADCTELMNTLITTPCTNGRVQEYVSRWRTGISHLQSAKYPFSIKVCISQFVRSLPFIAAFTPLHAELPYRITTTGDQDFGAFIALMDTILELDTIFCTSSHAQCPIRTPAEFFSATTTPTFVTPAAVPDTTSRPSKQTLTCSNCKAHGLRFTGHTDGTCFQLGGGMEGCWEEYLSNRG